MATLKQKMNEAFEEFNAKKFLEDDPIQVVHEMAGKAGATVADIEICAIWTAMMSWGRRDQIVPHAKAMMDLCDWHPADFVKGGDFYDLEDTMAIHRTLKGWNFKQVNHAIRDHYNLADVHTRLKGNPSLSNKDLIYDLCRITAPARLGSPERNSACKRINMLMRWMVRKDDVDLGLWQTDNVSPKDLFAIMDTHVAQQARLLGLITYPKESWKAVIELTSTYRSWDREDPMKYDFVLMTRNLK